MEIILLLGAWGVFILLGVYTYVQWKYDFLDLETVRKVWYLIFFLGSLIYLTKHPSSIFIDWKNYLVVLIIFVIVDSMIFLNLYFTKIGGGELIRYEKRLSETEKYFDWTSSKLENLETILNTYEFPSYTVDKEMFIQELEKFLQNYGVIESLNISLEKFNDYIRTVNKRRIIRVLRQKQTYFSSRDNLMVLPLTILDEEYVAIIETAKKDVEILKADAKIINIMLMFYVANTEIINEDNNN